MVGGDLRNIYSLYLTDRKPEAAQKAVWSDIPELEKKQK